MTWLLAILIVLALGGVAAAAAGRGTPMAQAYDDRPDALVPAGRPLVGGDLRRVRFSLAVRGYRMSEVDTLLDRLAAQLEQAEPAEPGEPAGGAGEAGSVEQAPPAGTTAPGQPVDPRAPADGVADAPAPGAADGQGRDAPRNG